MSISPLIKNQCCCQGLETQGQGLDVQGRGQGRGHELQGQGQGLGPALLQTYRDNWIMGPINCTQSLKHCTELLTIEFTKYGELAALTSNPVHT